MQHKTDALNIAPGAESGTIGIPVRKSSRNKSAPVRLKDYVEDVLRRVRGKDSPRSEVLDIVGHGLIYRTCSHSSFRRVIIFGVHTVCNSHSELEPEDIALDAFTMNVTSETFCCGQCIVQFNFSRQFKHVCFKSV